MKVKLLRLKTWRNFSNTPKQDKGDFTVNKYRQLKGLTQIYKTFLYCKFYSVLQIELSRSQQIPRTQIQHKDNYILPNLRFLFLFVKIIRNIPVYSNKMLSSDVRSLFNMIPTGDALIVVSLGYLLYKRSKVPVDKEFEDLTCLRKQHTAFLINF